MELSSLNAIPGKVSTFVREAPWVFIGWVALLGGLAAGGFYLHHRWDAQGYARAIAEDKAASAKLIAANTKLQKENDQLNKAIEEQAANDKAKLAADVAARDQYWRDHPFTVRVLAPAHPNGGGASVPSADHPATGNAGATTADVQRRDASGAAEAATVPLDVFDPARILSITDRADQAVVDSHAMWSKITGQKK